MAGPVPFVLLPFSTPQRSHVGRHMAHRRRRPSGCSGSRCNNAVTRLHPSVGFPGSGTLHNEVRNRHFNAVTAICPTGSIYVLIAIIA